MGTHIKEFLPQLLDMHDDWKKKLLLQWPTIIGSLKDKVIVEKVESDTIILGVFHPTWVQELSFLKPVLLQTINAYLEQPYIKHIKIKMAGIPKKRILTPKIAPCVAPITYTLSAQENHALKAIKDKELKKALSLFLQRCVNKQ